jgi:DMSO/TMAO reductase YedYZ heme-binding membrane subunit
MSGKTLPFALAVLLSLGAIAAALLHTPVAAEQALLAARWTARVAVPVFLVVYLAKPLLRLWPSQTMRELLRYRRQWGLAFALSMTIHLGALLVNILVFQPRGLGEIAAGIVAYAMIYIMAATSNDRSVKRMGRWWRYIHRAGLHYIWLIFFGSRLQRAIGEDPAYHASALIMAIVLLVALLIRLAAWFKEYRKRRDTTDRPIVT